ncbi:MAG: AMP-binding protein [Hyphomonadaceae bacterium]|nr:AMP-binding protein [Hyphomonadaceae bacterium]
MGRRPFQLARTRLTLFDALLRAKAAFGGRTKVLEDPERKLLSYTDIVRASFALGGRLKGLTAKGEAVGVLLPSSAGCAVTILALHAIGRVPAMLNFTAGALNLKSACESAQVRRVLTSRKFVELGKLEHLIAEIEKFAEITYLDDIKARIGFGEKMGALIKGAFAKSFAAKGDPDDTAVILFTSGSFGSPRGVALTHANIIANVEQAYAHVDFDPEWVFFNPLPMFHCFGLTGGTLLPLLCGHRAFHYPSPLHFKEIPKLLREVGANVLLATDTFAMQYARMSRKGELDCLKLIVLGAERVKPETRDIYMEKFGVELLEGYGATEASPVVAVNQPGAGNRHGSVGRILPGMEYKLEEVPGITEGKKLLLKGPNIMKGYIDPSKPSGIDAPVDGWHDTGDVVEIDAEGFVKIRGRVKRFAKIGGETVSLAAVENYAQQVWPEHNHAAVSIPDARKGEKIILFSDYANAEPGPLIEWAHKQGAPEIAVPKKIVKLSEIPVLGTGKTDYVALIRMAEQSDHAEAA